MDRRKFEPVRFVDEGMVVLAPYARFCPVEEREGALAHGTGVRCTVAVAAGYHARIVNAARGIDAWIHIGDLSVPVTEGSVP